MESKQEGKREGLHEAITKMVQSGMTEAQARAILGLQTLRSWLLLDRATSVNQSVSMAVAEKLTAAVWFKLGSSPRGIGRWAIGCA